MPKLFSPLRIKDVTFRNRIGISPMCMYSAIDGFANDWHLVHLGSRATGGAALIIQEATAVSPEGRISPGDLGLYLDEQIEMLQRINSFIHQQGAVAGVQLAHAGRKAGCARSWDGGKQLAKEDGGWTTVAPSALPFLPDDMAPLALDEAGIRKVILDFKMAASRSLKAGFKVLEIHAAHGYLIHQFLSPLSNVRTDNYGGSFENRIRLLLEIVAAIREVWPSQLPLFVRLSATDWVDGGWSVDETVQLSGILKQQGVDLIDASSGGMVAHAKIPLSPGYQVPFAERIKNETGILTGAVGLITQARQAEEILQMNQADLILIGRESLRNPNFVLNAAKILGVDVDWPLPYLRAK
ncbi:MAG: NADH:flavin oxidoreductase/NADH oxidase [Lentimicrobium sp.]|nr:NADH:flavin oxidoreductase/NADH oxidase [Lentimicrobium sp.]HPG33287.1 NADH:flavin oxidoreductase/NADH oxidase [Lentimicrobium sp.]